MILAPASKTQTSRFTSKRHHPDFHLVFLFGFFQCCSGKPRPTQYFSGWPVVFFKVLKASRAACAGKNILA
jgi:hypothetical protein